jgi:hypothetical protein
VRLLGHIDACRVVIQHRQRHDFLLGLLGLFLFAHGLGSELHPGTTLALFLLPSLLLSIGIFDTPH